MIEFYKGKSNCESIVIVAWGLEQSPIGLLVGKAPPPHLPEKKFAFNVITAIKQITMALKTIYLWPKKLFFMAKIPTPGQV